MPGIIKDSSAQTVYVLLQTASGDPATGIAATTSGLSVWYARPRAQPVRVGLNTLTSADTAYTSGGFVEVNSSSMRGIYRFDPPDAALVTGANFVVFSINMTNGVLPCPLEVELLDGIDVSAGKVNVGMVNSVLVSGVGTSANPWGPA